LAMSCNRRKVQSNDAHKPEDSDLLHLEIITCFLLGSAASLNGHLTILQARRIAPSLWHFSHPTLTRFNATTSEPVASIGLVLCTRRKVESNNAHKPEDSLLLQPACLTWKSLLAFYLLGSAMATLIIRPAIPDSPRSCPAQAGCHSYLCSIYLSIIPGPTRTRMVSFILEIVPPPPQRSIQFAF
jgi:hypothetical protein